MPFDLVTGQWRDDGYDPMQGVRQPAQPPGYNNPWYDGQVQGQQAQGGSLLPMPPNYTGDNGGGMDYTNPPYNPDVFGGGWDNSTGANWDSSSFLRLTGQDQQIGATTQPPYNPDRFGSGPSDFSNFGNQGQGQDQRNLAGGRPSMSNPQVMGQQLYPADNSLAYNPTQLPMLTPDGTPMQTPRPVGMNSSTARQPVVDIDPNQETYVRGLLENPNGPYAGRKPGDYGPIGSPDFVLNPTTQQDWVDRYNWFQQNPTAFTTGYTQPRDLPTNQYDFSKPNSVPYTAFLPNAFGETNAKQNGFRELQGVLNAEQLDAAQKLYGWQPDQGSGASNNPNQAYQRMYQLAAANPAGDYVVIKLDLGKGLQYGVVNREQNQAAQQARGFYAPGQRPLPTPPMQAPRPVNSGYPRSNSYGKSGTSSAGQQGQGGFSGKPLELLKNAAAAGAAGLKLGAKYVQNPVALPPGPQDSVSRFYELESQTPRPVPVQPPTAPWLGSAMGIGKPGHFGQYPGQVSNGWTWNGSDWVR
jgi:hypothetical protein